MSTLTIAGTPHVYDLTAPTAIPGTLVFIHGWLLSRHYWRPVIQRLSPTYQCLAYDLRGFGASQATAVRARKMAIAPGSNQQPEEAIATQHYTLAAYAQDLQSLLSELNLTRVWVVGHSLGGSIALWAAHLAPEQVEGVICVNAGGGIYLKEEFERFRAAGQQLVKFRARWMGQLPLLDWLFARANVARPVERCWGRQRLIDFVTADPAAALGALLETTTEAEVHRLPQIVATLRQPLHFIAGLQDDVMEPRYVHHLASFHPSFAGCGCNITELEHCGHLSMVECPDQVAETIRSVISHQL
jgi:2-succinyl-6-hydroxy-2,4-cyclohexadiene-1-carboxylate synthase